MSLNFCDLLVLGGDLSGVIAATLLAKRGMNVLLIDEEVDDPRTANLVTALDSRVFKSLVSKLMIPESRIQVVQENEVTCQLIYPRHRVDLSSSRDQLLKEIDREFSAERTVFLDFLTEVDSLREKHLETLLGLLPVVTHKEKKQFSQWVRQIPDQTLKSLWQNMSPELQSLLKLQLRFLSRGPLIEPLTLQLLLYLSPEGCTTFSIRGGLKELKNIFFERLDYFGGMVHPLAGDQFEILAKGREIRAVKMERHGFPTRCRFLLGNIDCQNFYRHLPTNLWSFLTKRRAEKLVPTEEQFFIQFEVEKEVLPGPMKENLVIIENPEKPLEELNYLELNLSPRSRGEGGTLLLTVGYRCSGQKEKGRDFFEAFHLEIEKKLHDLIPFAGSSLRRVFPMAESEDTLFPTQDNFSLFQRQGCQKRVYPTSSASPFLTLPFKNGILLGPNLLDWMGMEGKILGALKGVDLIWEKESKIKKH